MISTPLVSRMVFTSSQVSRQVEELVREQKKQGQRQHGNDNHAADERDLELIDRKYRQLLRSLNLTVGITLTSTQMS